MITDEQGREWLLQKLYDDGWRYIVGGDGTFVYVTKNKPFIFSGMYKANGDKYRCIEIISGTLPSLETCDVINIAEELGIVDWSKVKVDTPIYVRAYENNTWEKRHFAFFKDGKVYAWLSGVTSWSADDDEDVMSWNYAKLAEV
nr:MAG TPA: hypothetical protein [Caudoviricetes sp.]